jgi:hypothetical protein
MFSKDCGSEHGTILRCGKFIYKIRLGDVSVNFKKNFSMAAETLAALCMAALLVVACGGGGVTPVPAFVASAGVGEVLQFTLDAGNMVYSYTVINTSYAASGVIPGQTSSGTLLSRNTDGSYTVGPSLDGYIQSGKLFPVLGEVAGHVAIQTFPGASIPVFGVSNPTPTLLIVNGTYNYQGFSCSASGIANAASAVPGTCVSEYGTMTIAGINPTSASYSTCKGGDITNQSAASSGVPCTTPLTPGTIVATGTPGVYDFLNASNQHIGWFFAAMAPNGQVVAVIDHDDKNTPAYGHAALTTYAGLVAASGDGSYYVNDNEGKESWVNLATTVTYTLTNAIIYTTSYTSTAYPGVQGTLTPNVPWNGLSTYSIAGVSGVAMVSATGAYTHTSSSDPALFSTGAK